MTKQPTSTQAKEPMQQFDDRAAYDGLRSNPPPQPFSCPIQSLPSPSSDQSNRACQVETYPPAAAAAAAKKSSDVISPVLSLDPAEAEQLFDSWRPAMHHGYPFAPMPVCADFETWSVERPFLTAAIITTAMWGDMARQLEFGQRTLEYLVVQLIVKGQKNLDVLQALLVTFAWNFFYITKNPQATNLLQLAIGLVIDLGLNRVPDRNQATRLKLFAMRLPIHGRSKHEEKSLTLEERRTLLGCFYITSGVSVAFAKSQPLKWTHVMEESCNILEKSGQYETDARVVWLARSQRLLERIDEGFSNQDCMVMQPSGSPVLVLVRSWQNDLRKHWDNIPASLKENQLYDSALDSLPPPTGLNSAHLRLNRRVELYQALFDSLRSYFDAFFDQSPTEMHFTAFDILSKTANAMVILARIKDSSAAEKVFESIEDPISLTDTLDRAATLFADAEQAARADGHSLGEDHLFTRWTWRFKRFKKLLYSDVPEDRQVAVMHTNRGDRGGFSAAETPEQFPATGTELGIVPSVNSLNSAVVSIDFQDVNWKNDQWSGNPGMSQCPMS
ncbi:MAG: hypothetical protein M1828_004315 [Chrysothrix sp. TS-e1954]|nr:MAG: hypothetical protein M1828_004315 [Chrysothrix sp. TS-e1954]